MELPESPRSPAEFVLQSTIISSITAGSLYLIFNKDFEGYMSLLGGVGLAMAAFLVYGLWNKNTRM